MTNVKYLSYDGLTHYTEKLFEIIDENERVTSEALADLNTKVNTHTHTQYAASDHTHSYLPLNGGTMSGTINSQSIIPISNVSYNLGSSSKQFSITYTRYVDTVSGYNLRLRAAGVEHINMLGGNVNTTANIIPTVNGTYNLGSSSLKWNNVYSILLTTNRLITSGDGNAVCHIKGVVSSPSDYTHIYVANSDSTNTSRALILQNGYGNVGIGTTTPSEKLEVNGKIKATGFTGNLTGNADTATKASTVAITSNSENVACELFFQSSGRHPSTGTITWDNDLRYNPSKNTLMIGGMTNSVTAPTTANVVLDGTNKKLSLGESFIQYNSTTGCLEIIA